MLRKLKTFIWKTILLSFSILCLSTMLVYAQDNNELELYNRNEKVQLSKPLIHENEDYYIYVDDLLKINVQHEFTEIDDGFEFNLFSEDAFGEENKLIINATRKEDNQTDERHVNLYSYSNSVSSRKFMPLNSKQEDFKDIGDFESVILKDEGFYLSLNAIATGISYEYSINDSVIKLWITDKNHHVINGEISLPDGDIAPEDGLNINILVMKDEAELTDKHSLRNICMPGNENKAYYFIETDILSFWKWIMFEFDGNYKTICESINVKNGLRFDVTTIHTEKVPFTVNVCMPKRLDANDDVYTTIIFQRSSVYTSDEPVIKKGNKYGVVTLNIEKNFAGKVAIMNVSGDDRVFEYGYYGYGDLVLSGGNARYVFANSSKISMTLLPCYKISGQVVTNELNDGYKVKVSGVSDSGEEINFYEHIENDFAFSIKVPSVVSEYTLSVAYKPDVYCGYVSDGVSNYSGTYHTFENNSDYSEIRLKYEPYLPDLPIDAKINLKTNLIELKNLSDEIIKEFVIYCAHFRDKRLIYLNSIPADNLVVYNDYESYQIEYPTDYYKTDELKIFVWNNNQESLSLTTAQEVNTIYYPDDKEFYDVDISYKYYEAIKSQYLSGVMLEYEDGTFRPDKYILRKEAALMFCRMLGYFCGTYIFSCDDVSITNWESSYVGICVNENIFELENNKFRPCDNITVIEVYEAIQNLLKGENDEINSADLLKNIDDTNLERDITRAEFAQILYNYSEFSDK